MAELVSDCPRCGAGKITFEVKSHWAIARRHDWQGRYEAFCICRACRRSTTFVIALKQQQWAQMVESNAGPTGMPLGINNYFLIESYLSQKNLNAVSPPEHLPEQIRDVFVEAATCLSVECYNAAGTMFRLCIDLATRSRLPSQEENRAGLTAKVRRDLGLRLPWLLDNGLLPTELRELSTAIKEDGNDGAHAGNLTKEDAEDLLDFTEALLERLYTEPERLKIAEKRRVERRAK